MRDIRSDLRERLRVTVQQRRELGQRLQALETREQNLRALLQDEQATSGALSPPVDAADGPRLRDFIRGSLANGCDWSLDELKEHARGLGLNTAGASGRSLNIILVNLLREGSVVRLPGGRWRLSDQRKQLALDFVCPSSTCNNEDVRLTRAS